MLKHKKYKATNELIFSVFTYLYKKVNIPFFRDEDTYLYWMCDTLKDWLTDDEEDDYFEEDTKNTLLTQISQMEYIGDTILNKINNDENLNFWKYRLDKFSIKSDFDKAVFEISEKFYKLWQDYPNDNIFHYIINYDTLDNDILPMYKYLSFVCFFDSISELYQQLNETINNDLANYGEMEEPTIYQIFNGNDITEFNFDFIHRLFTYLDELINLF